MPSMPEEYRRIIRFNVLHLRVLSTMNRSANATIYATGNLREEMASPAYQGTERQEQTPPGTVAIWKRSA